MRHDFPPLPDDAIDEALEGLEVVADGDSVVVLRPRVASALDKDSLLKFKKPLRLFGKGGNPSMITI